jgi:Uma2 family endonuclease
MEYTGGVKRMSDPAMDRSGRFTYRDYKGWPEEERWELIDGIAYDMSPAPTLRHQGLSRELTLQFALFLRGKPCRPFAAPVDVLLPRPGQDDDEADCVVEPDLVVVCDPSKLVGKYIRGAPDLVVEILSPSTTKKDLSEKFGLYERVGVREYWVVEPKAEWLHRYALGPDGRFGEPLAWERGSGAGPLASTVLEGFALDPELLFAEASR